MFKSGKIARLRHTPRILISSLEFLLPQIHRKGVNNILRNTNTRIGQQRSCKPAFDEGNYREMSLTPSVLSVYPRVYRMVHTVAGGGWRWCGGGMIIRPRSN